MSGPTWLAFLAAAIVIAVSPGPGAVLSMATGIRHGYGAALRAIAGLEAAIVVQIGVVAAGLGAVLATSETAFTAIKLAGAAYLVWLGVQKWRSAAESVDVPVADGPPAASGFAPHPGGPQDGADTDAAAAPARETSIHAPLQPAPAHIREGRGVQGLFLQGLLVNLSNPKAIVFVAALLPQFVDPRGPQAVQYAQITLTLVAVDVVVMSGYALLAARFRRWLRDDRAMRRQNRFFGALFVGAGTWLAFSSRAQGH